MHCDVIRKIYPSFSYKFAQPATTVGNQRLQLRQCGHTKPAPNSGSNRIEFLPAQHTLSTAMRLKASHAPEMPYGYACTSSTLSNANALLTPR